MTSILARRNKRLDAFFYPANQVVWDETVAFGKYLKLQHRFLQRVTCTAINIISNAY